MLSILIPTYNYNIFPLVSELRSQCETCGIAFEIIALDDASLLFHPENEQVNTLQNCSYAILEANIGRSAIRNLLAKKATYNQMLFLDADVFPKDKNFIANYVNAIDSTEKVIAGGLLYTAERPETELLLRWVYGSKREVISKELRSEKPYQSFLSSNFIITKSLIAKVPFNESIPDLRREDTLFSFNLMQHKIAIKHIDNPVYHLGLDRFEVALQKENESLDGLKYLLQHNLLSPDYIKISRLYATIKKLGLHSVFYFFHLLARPMLLKNLSGPNPSLYLFDFYRVGYLCKNDKP